MRYERAYGPTINPEKFAFKNQIFRYVILIIFLFMNS